MKYVIALTETLVWDKGEQLLFMGRIDNMPGHCVVMRNNGMIHHGYHSDSFFFYSDKHVGEHCLSDFLKSAKDNTCGYFYLPKNLTTLLIELNDSHTPDAAENSFVIQATKLLEVERNV